MNLFNMVTFSGVLWAVCLIKKPFMDQWNKIPYVLPITLRQFQLYVKKSKCHIQ